MLEKKAVCDWRTPRLEMQSSDKDVPHLEGGKHFRMLKPDLRQTSIGKKLPRAPQSKGLLFNGKLEKVYLLW